MVPGGCDIEPVDPEATPPVNGWARGEVRVLALVLGVAVVVAFVIAAVTAGILDTSDADDAGVRNSQVFFRAHSNLCDAADLAHDGKAELAGRAFDDHAHDTLHELAAGLDPADAAPLLEAKAKVEADLSALDAGRTVAPNSLASHFLELADKTDTAIQVARKGDPRSCRPGR